MKLPCIKDALDVLLDNADENFDVVQSVVLLPLSSFKKCSKDEILDAMDAADSASERLKTISELLSDAAVRISAEKAKEAVLGKADDESDNPFAGVNRDIRGCM